MAVVVVVLMVEFIRALPLVVVIVGVSRGLAAAMLAKWLMRRELSPDAAAAATSAAADVFCLVRIRCL